MKTAFIGHRKIFTKGIYERLVNVIRIQIKNGCKVFTMGTHGDFDKLALNACRQLRHTCDDMIIEVVITSLNKLKQDNELNVPYFDVETVMYDIENVHYKRQITLSNRLMIDGCDTLICYVDTLSHGSGAKTALRYAEKQGLKIINLYREEDKPFYGMTKEEKDAYLKSLFEKIDKK